MNPQVTTPAWAYSYVGLTVCLEYHNHGSCKYINTTIKSIFVGWVPDRQIVSYLLHSCHSIFPQKLPFNVPYLNVTLPRGGKFAKLSLENSDVDFALRTSLDDGLMAGGGTPVSFHSWSRPNLIDTCSKSLSLAISEPFLISLSAGPVIQFFNPVSENSPMTGTMPRTVPLNAISLTPSTLNIPTHISWTASIDQTRI